MEREKEILNKIHEKGKELDIPSGLAPAPIPVFSRHGGTWIGQCCDFC